MSQTFHQTTYVEKGTPVQNTGEKSLTVDNSRREGDEIEISNVQSTVYAGRAFKNPNTTGIRGGLPMRMSMPLTSLFEPTEKLPYFSS